MSSMYEVGEEGRDQYEEHRAQTVNAEILTRMDIGYEQTQLALLQCYANEGPDDLIRELSAIMAIWDRIRKTHNFEGK